MKNDTRLLVEGIEKRPYHRFNIAFSLMSLLPLLAIFYLLTSNFFSLEILRGQTGIIVLIALVISGCGYLLGYSIIRTMLQRVIFYAQRAKRSDQLKSKLIASVSHEFKNPLGALKLCLFDMTDGLNEKMSEEQKEMLFRCNNIIDRLGRLVTNLLDVYRIEAAMIGMNKTLCSLLELLEVQIKEFENTLHKKNINLRFIKEGSDENLLVWADEEKVSLVFNNLLSNAVKYTPERGLIIIRIAPVNDFVQIEFQDTGSGIPPDKLNKVFDKFEKLDASKEGTGLGLAIAKDIVELHKGTIEIQSTLGEGSKFTVLFPRSLRYKRRRHFLSRKSPPPA